MKVCKYCGRPTAFRINQIVLLNAETHCSSGQTGNPDDERTISCRDTEVNNLRSRVEVLESPEMAERIATIILTVGSQIGDVECTRAQMMLGAMGEELNMGGRNKYSIIECVLECLTYGKLAEGKQ